MKFTRDFILVHLLAQRDVDSSQARELPLGLVDY